MTTDESEVGGNDANATATPDKISTVTLGGVFKSLSENSKIIFKSQQISEPDLDWDEKVNIAKKLYEENVKLFFGRFGCYLSNDHLEFFKSSIVEDEIQEILSDLLEKLAHKTKTIKNRRYAALQEMSKEEGYFSESEMMKREPNLYEQLVGQYLTETERRLVNGDCDYDPGEGSFANILLQGIEKDRVEQLRKDQKKDEGPDLEDDEDISEESNENGQLFPKVPNSFRKQWGNFEDEDSQPAGCSGEPSKKPKKQKYVTAEERQLLKDEFIGIMHSRFIEGNDEHFDYSTVDDNDQWDDLKQINQDKEDAYFDDDDDDEADDQILEKMEDDEEDELDLYMKSIQ